MTTKEERAFQLFNRGLTPRDPEVKKIVPDAGTRRNYYLYWRQQQGLPPPIETEAAVEVLISGEENPRTRGIKAPLEVVPKEISIGNIRIPYSDWGYSSTFNLFIVAATYEQVCKPEDQGGFGYGGKVGDFCADCVKMFRRIFDFDEVKH